jgi:hypothetical protein
MRIKADLGEREGQSPDHKITAFEHKTSKAA